jgi:hypothetical protein
MGRYYEHFMGRSEAPAQLKHEWGLAIVEPARERGGQDKNTHA